MTEEALQEQEKLRLAAEEKVEALKRGAPLAGTVAEFFQLFEAKLNDAPLLKDFMLRMQRENEATIEAWRESYERRLAEQDLAIGGLEAEVAVLRGYFVEFRDNFNVFANKLLQQAERRNNLINQAVIILDRELTR